MDIDIFRKLLIDIDIDILFAIAEMYLLHIFDYGRSNTCQWFPNTPYLLKKKKS